MGIRFRSRFRWGGWAVGEQDDEVVEPSPEQRPYLAHGAAEVMFYSGDPEVVLCGPAGTGKSRCCLEKLHACMRVWPGARGLIARATRASLTESALVTFEEKVL